MKPSQQILTVIIFLGILLQISSVAQTISDKNTERESVRCLVDEYRGELIRSFELRRNKIENRIKTRSNTGQFEIHIHIDTSYERLRTGGYNNNSTVLSYMNNLTTQAVQKFNIAAPNWDLSKNLTVTFFDAATPFNYGNNIVQTIENYLDWLIANNFPGDDDAYIFYTGKYTNIGVTYLATLCLPGVSLMGFVSSQIPNEALSSHEWLGHCPSAIHYDSLANIMKSTNATYPWHGSSLIDIEDFLDFSDCVENYQAPLALDEIVIHSECIQSVPNFEIEVLTEAKFGKIEIQTSLRAEEWISVQVIDYSIGHGTYQGSLTQNRPAHYVRAVFKSDEGIEIVSPMVDISKCKNYSWYMDGSLLKNPSRQLLRIFDLQGRMIVESHSEEIFLNSIQNQSMVILMDENQSYMVNLFH